MSWRFLLVAVVLFLVGCSQPVTTNRIYSNRTVSSRIIPRGQPLSVELVQLQRAPEAYEDTLVRVSGRYRRSPIVVCDGIARLSPATWRLEQNDAEIGAGGFESLVQNLLPPGLTVTVDGVWRSWRGPVGCGKDAPQQSIWYLQVTNIVSPSPVARVTLTPLGDGPVETPDQTDATPVDVPTPAATEPPETPVGAATAASTPATAATNTRAASTPSDGETPSPTPTTDDDDADGGAVSPTATTNGTITATATAENGATATATVTGTLSPSVTPGGTVEDRGDIEYQVLHGGHLESDETHSWQFLVQSGDVITISVAPRVGTDIALSVLDPAGRRVVEQNDSPAGAIEQIAGIEAEGSGEYRLVITEASANETYYSLMVVNSNDSDYYPIIFPGLLQYGSSASNNIEADTDHIWFFFGNAQEVVTINVSPTDQSDLVVYLFDPEGEALEEDINEAGSGGAEQLRNYRLQSTGMFAILVGEDNFNEASYSILVSRN
ncbi:MAG: hypothetical protein ACOC9E_00260 [Chloroflexota bacterium]